MSEFAPSLPLFFAAVIVLIMCIFNLVLKQDTINKYSKNFKLLFYTSFIVASIITVWGLVFFILYWVS